MLLKWHHWYPSILESKFRSPLKPGEEKFAKKKKKKKRKRKELHITTLSQSLLTTASRTRYHVSAKSRVSPSRVKKKSGNVGGEKRKKRKERKKEGGGKKMSEWRTQSVCVCPHPGKETGRTRFHDFKQRGKCGRTAVRISGARRRIFFATETSMHTVPRNF